MNGAIKSESKATANETANAEAKLLRLEEDLVRLCDPTKTVDDMEHIMTSIDRVFLENQSIVEEYTATNSMENIAPLHICPRCGNSDPSFFRIDPRSGDTVCIGINEEGCGEVVQDHHIHEGQQYRKLEDKEDRDHFGPPSDPLMPQAHNMATNIVAAGPSLGDTMAQKLQMASKYVEMNLSNMDSDERRTREGYKSQQKRQAFSDMEHLAACLHIPNVCVERAKVIFAVYRQVMEHVHNFKTVVGACIALAYRELAGTTNLDEGVVKTARPTATHLANILATMRKDSNQAKTIEVDTSKMPADMRVHHDIALQHWNLEQVRDWLYTIDQGKFRQQADTVLEYLQQSQTAAQSSTKSVQLNSTLAAKKSVMFKRPLGNISDRVVKRARNEAGEAHSVTSVSASGTLTPGQRLLDIPWEKAVGGENEASNAFRAAFKRRREAEIIAKQIRDENRLRQKVEVIDRRTRPIDETITPTAAVAAAVPPLLVSPVPTVELASPAIVPASQSGSEWSIEVEDLPSITVSGQQEIEIVFDI